MPMKIARFRMAMMPVVVTTLFLARPSRAQDAGDEGHGRAETAATGEPSAERPPDVVLLKNGGMVRGTIEESIPGESVTIVTGSGKSRTFRTDEVRYAGPASDAPRDDGGGAGEDERPQRRRPRHATAPSRAVKLTVLSNQSDLTLHMRGGLGAPSSEWRALCTMPCDVDLEPGRYVLGLSKGAGKPVVAGEGFDLQSDTTLHASYDDSHTGRMTGWFILGFGTAVGSMLLGYSLVAGGTECGNEPGCVPQKHDTAKWSGIILMTTGLCLGLPMGLDFDDATLTSSHESWGETARGRVRVIHWQGSF